VLKKRSVKSNKNHQEKHEFGFTKVETRVVSNQYLLLDLKELIEQVLDILLSIMNLVNKINKFCCHSVNQNVNMQETG